MRIVAALLIGTLIATAGVSLPSAADEASRPRPNVVILVLDACRVDKFGCYGFPGPTSPAVDAVAADPDATLFRRHYVQAGWTKPSTASLFTGTYAFQHGLLGGDDIALDESTAGPIMAAVLDGSFMTLAEGFHGAGYRTFGFFRSENIDARYGFGQGFESWEKPLRGGSDGTRSQQFLDRIAGLQGPFFAYLHLEGCHQPYRLSDRDREYMTTYAFPYNEKARAALGVDFTRADMRQRVPAGLVRLDEADLRFANLLVAAKLRQVNDSSVKRLVAGLKRLGLYDSTLLVVTADHGDELLDHGGFSHGQKLWEVITHVPLVVKFPRGGRPAGLGTEVKAVTQSVDLLPSLFRLVGVPVPEGVAGADIFTAPPRGWAFSEAVGAWALVREKDKLLALGDRHLLFDLRRDPAEKSDVAPRAQPTVDALREHVDALRASLARFVRKPPQTQLLLDKETVEQLRNLGYVH